MNNEKINSLLETKDESNIKLAISLAKNTLSWSYENIMDCFLEKVDTTDLLEDKQEDVCNMCEDLILGCNSISSTFICEGCACEEAGEMFLDNYFDELIND